jgi:hypothetical protein
MEVCGSITPRPLYFGERLTSPPSVRIKQEAKVGHRYGLDVLKKVRSLASVSVAKYFVGIS